MPNLEQTEAWGDILRLRETLSLRELAQRFSTTPGAISAALTRTGTVRAPSIEEDEDLPPEAGAPDEPDDSVDAAAALQQVRQGSKDMQIAQHLQLLGQLPDAEVARRAGVSIRTIASFRARHNIPGYRGPRRTARGRGEESEEPEAEEAPPAPAPRPPREPDARRAWQVVWRDARGEQRGVLLATDLVAAAAAARDTVQGEIIGLMLAGTFL